MSAEKFEESPIIFGDFMKVGASQSDRIYEELVNMKKVPMILSEVSKPSVGGMLMILSLTTVSG